MKRIRKNDYKLLRSEFIRIYFLSIIVQKTNDLLMIFCLFSKCDFEVQMIMLIHNLLQWVTQNSLQGVMVKLMIHNNG